MKVLHGTVTAYEWSENSDIEINIRCMLELVHLVEEERKNFLGKTPFGIPYEIFFIPITDIFPKMDAYTKLHLRQVRYVGEALLKNLADYKEIPDEKKMFRTVQKKYSSFSIEREEYYVMSKDFRMRHVIDFFGSTIPNTVATVLGINLRVFNSLQIGDRTYRDMLNFQHDPKKEKIAMLYREYHLQKFFLWVEKIKATQ